MGAGKNPTHLISPLEQGTKNVWKSDRRWDPKIETLKKLAAQILRNESSTSLYEA